MALSSEAATTRGTSKKRPRRRATTLETEIAAEQRSLYYFDAVQELLLNVSKDGRVIPEGVQMQEGSSVMRIETDMLRQGGDEDEENIFSTSSAPSSSSFRLMHVPCMFGLSRGNSTSGGVFVSARGALLALHDFNNRNEAVVRNLKELLTDENGKECDLHMTLDFYDTGRSPRIATKILSQHVYQRGFPYQPAAIVGASRSAVSIPMAVVNTAQEVPQISYSSTSSTLNNRDMYPLFGRTVPSTDGDAHALIEYFQGLNVTHMGILYVSDDYGTAYRLSLEKAASAYGIQVTSAAIIWDQEESNQNSLLDGIVDAVDVLRATGYRYFVGVIFHQHLDVLIKEASQAGIMGPGYIWIFGDGISKYSFNKYSYPAGTPEAKALHGLGVIGTGISTNGGYHERFKELYSTAGNTSDFRAYYESKSPLHAADFVKFPANDTFSKNPGQFPPLSYDAVMALGIAGCRAKSDFFSGQELFEAFQAVEFEGASGIVSIESETGSRYFNSTTYFITNTLAQPPDEDGMVSYSTRVAAEYCRGTGAVPTWYSPDGIPFNYSDMTDEPPPSLPPYEPRHDAVDNLIWVTSSLALIIMLSAFGFASWTWINRTSHVVRASQPLFLIIICVGVILMAAAVVTFGVDSPPFRFEFANAACMLNWWFWCIGFGLSFSALFAKTWRINKILASTRSFRRMVVEPKDVLLPGTLVLLANVGVLLFWQLVSPLRYEFEYQKSYDEYGRSNQFISTCNSDNESLETYCLGILFIINGSAIVAANVQAFRARNIITEYSESNYIGLAMAISLQAILIGMPIFFYSTTPRASYLAKALCMLATCASILYLMFVPKIAFWRQHQKRAKERALKRASCLQRLEQDQRRENNDDDAECFGNEALARRDDDAGPAADCLRVISPEPCGKDDDCRDVGIQVYARPPESNRVKEESMGRHSVDRSSGLRIVSSHHSRGFSRSRGSDYDSFRARFDGCSSGDFSEETLGLKTKESDPETKGSTSEQPSVEDACTAGLLITSRHSRRGSSRRSRASSGRDGSSSFIRSRFSSGDASQETLRRKTKVKESHPDTKEEESEPFVDRSSGFLVVASNHSAPPRGRGSRDDTSDREGSTSLRVRLSSSDNSREVLDCQTKESEPNGTDPFARTAVTYGSEYSA